MEQAKNNSTHTTQTASGQEAPGVVCPNCGHVHEHHGLFHFGHKHEKQEHAQHGHHKHDEEPEHRKSLSDLSPRSLFLRNALAVIAAWLFFLSVIFDYGHMTLKALAYIIGALAYLGEILLLTDCFRHKPQKGEMFMPYLFGAMYIVLGLSYAFTKH
ncbi:MAG: DUF308 domain-containing protein [Clostridiales bacterium]|nr:DUF308 domain-containing protein [Clostridiales bacterium]